MNRLCIVSLCALLGACSGNLDDLVDYTKQVRQQTTVNIKPAPTFKQMEAVQYTASEIRSPFTRAPSENTVGQVAGNAECAQPNTNRRKHKLESYGLDALKMSGVFSSGGQRYALVSASDGSLHKVRVGDYIGLFNGRVKSISSTEISINEFLPDGAGCFKQKTATLTMSGVFGDDNNV